MAKRWADEENATIEAIAKEGLTLISQMHRLPGRTWNAAKIQASRLDVSISAAVVWTPRDREKLHRIYASNESIKVGLRRLLPHRSYLAAKGEAQRLGLTGTKTRLGRTGYSWVERAIESVLEDGQRLTVKQLAAKTGASINAIDKIVAKLRGKKFRVGDWTRAAGVGNWAGMWELGAGPDAPRPPRKTATECCRTSRERQRIRAGQINPFASLLEQVSP